MKGLRRTIGMICLFLIILTGCETKREVSTQIDGNRVYEQSGKVSFFTNDGYYFTNDNGFLNFFDYESKKNTLVCSSANCKAEAQLDETSEAYVGNSAGFVSGEKLYIVKLNDSIEEKYSLIKSNLDRSEQRDLGKINSDVIHSYAVADKTAYFAVDGVILKESDAGAKQQEPKHNCSIVAIDLETGKQKVLMTPKQDYNNEIKIFAMNDTELYISYTYFDQFFDGTNYEEAHEKSDTYVLTIHSGELTSILPGRAIMKGAYANKTLYTLERTGSELEQTENTYTISKSNAPDYQPEVIAVTNQWPILNEKEWIYQDMQSNKFVSLDLATADTKEITIHPEDNMIIYDEAKDYYFILDHSDGTLKNGFILKTDYVAGNQKIISVH